MPHDPGTAASVLGAASALLALVAMTRVACIDMRSLEIDPDWAAFAAWSGLGALVAVEGLQAWPEAVAVAALAGGAAWLLALLRPGRIGQGDIGLLALVGLVAGPALLTPVLCLAVVFSLASCAAYGLARGKRPQRLFRHMVPAAPAFVAALAPVFAWRVASAIRPDLVPRAADGAVFIALAGAAVLSAGLLAGALPMAVRRRSLASAATACGLRGCTHQPSQGRES